MAGGTGGGTAGGTGGTGGGTGGGTAGGTGGGTAGGAGGGSPVIAGCAIFPTNHIFNTPIAALPVDSSSGAYMTTIGSHNIHLDLGQSVNMAMPSTYYGIPYNVVNASTLTWLNVAYQTQDTSFTWMPRDEADCAVGTGHTLVSPCLAATAPTPQLPIPSGVLVEGGVFPDVSTQVGGDHHILILDSNKCQLWEAYHAYTGTTAPWDIFGSAFFDLSSNALRPAGWTSADAAGFPILPLLLRADEASTGVIRHALRFTLPSIRKAYVWPGRHLTGNATSLSLPPMGQLFRLKASYVIPSTYSVQSKAILQALKTYGVYLSDGGSAMYIQGEPSAGWSSSVFSEVQSVNSSQFEAVDLTPIKNRTGFDVNSATVPP